MAEIPKEAAQVEFRMIKNLVPKDERGKVNWPGYSDVLKVYSQFPAVAAAYTWSDFEAIIDAVFTS